MADESTTEGATANGNTETPAATPPATTGIVQATPPAQPPAGKTFTQEELNRLLAEEKKKVRGQYADYDDLKAKAAKLTEIEQAQMTEAQKLQAQLEAAQKAIATAEQQRLEALETVKVSTIRAAVVSKAAELNFENPDDAYSLLDKSSLTINEAGKVEGVEAALKTLAEQKKYLIKKHGTTLEPFDPAAHGAPLRETDAQRRARIYGSGGSIFDEKGAASRGGGVVWPKGIPVE